MNAKPELWDLYNAARERTGREHVRGEPIPQGYYHLVVHVWIRNSAGNYLISQRSADRPAHPLKWECVGGSALKGEDSLTAALRETREELGLTLSPEDGRLVYSVTGRVVNGVRFTDIVFRYDGPVDLSLATTKEVAQTAWLDKTQIKTLFDQEEFVNTLGYFFDIDMGENT